MTPLRVRDLLKHMDGTQTAQLKKLLPKHKVPDVHTYPYPAALLRLLPADERYSLLGCIAEEVLRSEAIDQTVLLTAIKKWYPAFAEEAALLKSKTTDAFLEHLVATKTAWKKVTVGALTFDTELEVGLVQGHPDAQTPTQVFEVKLTGQLDKNWNDFLFQVYAYAALSPSTTDIYLVLPLQRLVWHASVADWPHPPYRDLLQSLSVARQDASAEKSPIPGQLLQAKYASAYAEHIAGLPVNAKGKQPTTDVMGFASKCRKELFVDDWAEHERIWDSAQDAKPLTKPAKKSKAEPVIESNSASSSMSEELAALEEETKSVKSVKSAKSAKSAKKLPEVLPEALPAPKPISKKAAAKKPATPSEEAKAAAEQWKNKGKVYMKNVDNQVWQFEDGSAGDYVGFYNGTEIIKGALAAK